MIGDFREQRANYRDVVDVLADFWEDLGNLDAGFTGLGEFKR